MKRVVLIRPAGPRNVGSVLRATANFGPAELVLVQPARPALLLHPDFEQMAHGVPDQAGRVRIVDSLDEALADVTTSYGFTVRARDHRELSDWREVRGEVAQRAASDDELVALVFGSEESGLSGAETDPLHTLVRMAVTGEHRSINLAMAATIVLSHLHFEQAPSAASHGSTPLSGTDRIFLTKVLVEALGSLTTSASARRDLEASVQRVFSRTPLETRDARAWHLLARAVGAERRPQDYGLPPQEKGVRQRTVRGEDKPEGEA
ncbi:MAG: TrmH family RNA methyltransferase [Planctomycetota bacterium]|jgi:TrmH family RNA methyltransferase